MKNEQVKLSAHEQGYGSCRLCSLALPLVPVLQLQGVHHLISSVRLGVAVSPFELQALWPSSSTLEPGRQGW